MSDRVKKYDEKGNFVGEAPVDRITFIVNGVLVDGNGEPFLSSDVEIANLESEIEALRGRLEARKANAPAPSVPDVDPDAAPPTEYKARKQWLRENGNDSFPGNIDAASLNALVEAMLIQKRQALEDAK